jgi:1-deoxy-D-xylulose-5-phosphate reductoisomerase
LVAAGPVFLEALKTHQTRLLPIDSEHSAIFQILDDRLMGQVEKVTLTASGGPFRDWGLEAMQSITPKQAVQHPNWVMGAKISVDSATMMNKGLEIIEASYLFGLEPAKLDAVIHPQSIVHSFVAYHDGSVLAQMGMPDMRTPISYALAWPQRMKVASPALDLATVGALTFEAVDEARFPCFSLALHALQAGQGKPTVLNAANEVAVAAFLEGRLPYLAIAKLVEKLLDCSQEATLASLDDVMALDAETRAKAHEWITQIEK